MRLYTFVCGNYLSQLQRGIQTAHVLGEMVRPFLTGKQLARDAQMRRMFVDWLNHHKTIMVMNAGNHVGVKEVYANLLFFANNAGSRFMKGGTRYPVAYFNEDEQSLNKAWTAAAIVVPANLYEKVEAVRNHQGDVLHYTNGTEYFAQGSPEFGIVNIIKSHRLVQS